MKTCFLKLITCVKPVSCIPARRNVSLDVILMLMFIRNFSVYSCDMDGETFENINFWVGLISRFSRLDCGVCTLLIVIVLWLVTKFCAVVFLLR